MDSTYVGTVGITYAMLFILSQRIVQRHQRAFRWFVLFTIIVLFLRGNRFQENIVGLLIALVISYLFWLLIGRYNKVGNEDDDNIKVYGLDD